MHPPRLMSLSMSTQLYELQIWYGWFHRTPAGFVFQWALMRLAISWVTWFCRIHRKSSNITRPIQWFSVKPASVDIPEFGDNRGHDYGNICGKLQLFPNCEIQIYGNTIKICNVTLQAPTGISNMSTRPNMASQDIRRGETRVSVVTNTLAPRD